MHVRVFIVFILYAMGSSPAFSNNLFSRRLVGPAADFVPEVSIKQSAVETSFKDRRQTAWKLTQEIIQNISLHEFSKKRIPKWMAWYQASEFSRLYSHFEDPSTNIQEDWQDLVREPSWKETQFENWKTEILSDDEKTLGASALSRNYFSPEVFSHYFRSKQEVSDCISELLEEVEPTRSCFVSEFPANSIAIKAQWLPLDMGIPIYATDEEHILRGLQSKQQRWNPRGRSFDIPSGSFIVKKNNRRYLLAGLHMMIKVLPDWFWISLWWSPEPNKDFGEDRPANWIKLHPQWTSYKLCSVSGFEEKSEIDSKFETDYPTLSKTVRRIREVLPESQWCSNPFLEKGNGNMATNCIGCHQHSGTNLSQSHILNEPRLSQQKVRSFFPTDYMWSFHQGPRSLGHQMHEIPSSIELK